MASSFKEIGPQDSVSTKTMLHEAIPLTGTIISGTYTDFAGAEHNIKTFSHGMFQSIYDYPYLSSSANHVLDLTVGYSSVSKLSSSTNVQNDKKINIYNQMAQMLVGFDVTGGVRRFDRDGNIADGGEKMTDCFFVNFTRLLTKDEIKKGTFQMTVYTGSVVDSAGTTTPYPTGAMTIQDADAGTYLVNSPVGEYTLLHTSSGGGTGSNVAVGLLYYQAGIAVVTSSIFGNAHQTDQQADGTVPLKFFGDQLSSSNSVSGSLTGSTINNACDGFRNRLKNVQFNNTTELNSTIYFCRLTHNEFNYSANPTYLSASQIRVKNQAADLPVSYITTVGLYSTDNELLAVGKLSEPLKKSPNNEFTLRVRLDY
jgi:hypothetical protein